MAAESGTGGGWQQRVAEAQARAEGEVSRAIRYLNDEVVPEIRRDGVRALRTAAEELRRLAAAMDGLGGSPPPGER